MTMVRRRHGNCANMLFVLIPQVKRDTRWHTTVVPLRVISDHSLILTPEFGPGVTPGARLMRPTPKLTTPNQSPSLQDQILNHVSLLECLIKQQNEKSGMLITPICLTFEEEVDTNRGNDKEKGGVGVDDDLKRPYKEVLESPFTRVPEVMQTSAFMRNSKCPELAIRFVDQVPQTVTEMMKQVDDFVKSEEAFKSTELPKGEQSEKGHEVPYKGFLPPRAIQGGGPPRSEGCNAHNRRDHYPPYVSLRQMGRRPKEILAMDLQLQLPPPFPLVGTPKKENIVRYYDLHGEKGHYTNNCFHLKSGRCIVPIQHYLGTNEDERTSCCLVNHTCDDEVPNTKRIAMLVSRRDAIFEGRQIEVRQASLEEPSEEKTGEEKEEGSIEDRRVRFATTGHGWHSKTDQPACPECKSKRYPSSTKAEDVGQGKKQSSDEESRGMAQSGDSKGGTVPHMDIKPGPSKKDSAFQIQLGRNLEAYVDDMVIKSRTEKDMIMNVMETFDNLKKINMKLHPKKCSFGFKEGKFLGYMVTSEGIRANPKKTKAVADMQSPKTLKEMQSLSGKLAALNCFLSYLAERAMPFFDTLKNITKENKDDFHLTEATERAFQELKTTAGENKHQSGTSVGLSLKQKKLHPVRKVSTMSVTPISETTVVLRSTPIKVITDHPIKQILNKLEASGKLAKYAVELGTYNIAYMS
nr:reverse transcriptase domain-containing protein [Tanacetum cinerariifolium]